MPRPVAETTVMNALDAKVSIFLSWCGSVNCDLPSLGGGSAINARAAIETLGQRGETYNSRWLNAQKTAVDRWSERHRGARLPDRGERCGSLGQILSP